MKHVKFELTDQESENIEKRNKGELPYNLIFGEKEMLIFLITDSQNCTTKKDLLDQIFLVKKLKDFKEREGWFEFENGEYEFVKRMLDHAQYSKYDFHTKKNVGGLLDKLEKAVEEMPN